MQDQVHSLHFSYSSICFFIERHHIVFILLFLCVKVFLIGCFSDPFGIDMTSYLGGRRQSLAHILQSKICF